MNACQQVDNEQVRNWSIDHLKDSTVMTAHHCTGTGLAPIDSNSPVGPHKVSACDLTGTSPVFEFHVHVLA